MKASECRFHVKRKYGECWRMSDGTKRESPPRYSDRCDGRERACPEAEKRTVKE